MSQLHEQMLMTSGFINQSGKHGYENFSVHILYMSKDAQYTRSVMEQFFIEEYQTMAPKGYNMIPGGGGNTQTPEVRAKISHANKGKIRTPEMNAANRERSKLLGWITDGVSSKRVLKADPIPDGWRRGRIVKSGVVRTKPTVRPKFPNGYKRKDDGKCTTSQRDQIS